MGLDKQPSPPKRKVSDENEEKTEDCRKDDVNHKLSETSSGVGIGEENKESVSQSSSAAEEGKEFEVMESEATKDEIKSDEYSDEHERDQRSAADNAYDEDFEADEEKSDEKVNEERQADDQMNGMSKSPSDDEKDNLDHEKESKNSSQKALQASDRERDESDGYSESDSEEDKQGKGKAADWEMAAAARKIQSYYRKHRSQRQTQGVKPDKKCVPSLSPSSTLYSSDNDSEGEARKQDDEKDNIDIHSEYDNEVTETQREEGQETDVEEEEEMGEADNTEAKNVPVPFHKKITETNLHYMTTVSEKLKLVGSVDTREDRDDVSVHLDKKTLEAEHRSKESLEDEREGDCKSVKEKIAEAFENDPLLSSEPEPSDSSTEDEEQNIAATQDKHEVPDGVSLAEELTKHKSQKVAEQEEERQMVGKERALEEEEVVDEEGSKVAALEEECPAQNVATVIEEQKVKKVLVTEERELEAAAAKESDLEMDNIGKKITHEKEELSDSEAMKGEDEVKELEGTSLTDVASKGEDILYGYQLPREQVEYQNFTEGSLVIGKVSEGKEKSVEAAEIVGTRELVEKNIMEEEAHESMKEIVEGDEALGTTLVQRDPVEETLTAVEEESGGSQCLKERELETEAVETANIIEEEKIVKTELKNASGMEVDSVVSRSNEAVDIVSIDEKATASEESIAGGNSFEEVPYGVEKIVQKVSIMCEEELEKTSPEASEMKNIVREEDSEQEKVEPCVEEPLLDWENEGSISAMEDENKKGQGKKVIIEEGETLDKLNTGGEATIKAKVKSNKTAQEENSLAHAVEEDIGGAEEMMSFEVAVPERKLVIEKEALFAEEQIKTVPEAITLVAEETTRREEEEGKVDVEEAERKVTLKEEVAAEKAEREVAVKGEVDAEEAERKVADKEEVAAEEAERKVAVKGEVDAEEAEREVVVKGEVAAEEAEREVTDKEEAERKMADKEEVAAEEAERKVAVNGEVGAEEAEREVVVKGEVAAEEAERKVADKEEVAAEEAERKVVVKGEVEAEEAEGEVVVKGEVDAKEAENGQVDKREVDTEEAEREVAVKGEVKVEDPGTEREVVSMDIGPEGEIVSEVTIMGRENEVSILGVMVAEAEKIPESSAQEVALVGGLTQDKRMMDEPTIQGEVEKPSEETVVGKTSADLQKEEVTVDEEETGTEDQMIGEGVISLKVVEEALLIGIQQLITDVSQLNVGVEDKKEELDAEVLAEEKSSHENPTREELLADVVAKERKSIQSDEAEKRGTEHGQDIHMEEKERERNKNIEAGDCPEENLLGTETIPLSAQQEQLQEISARIINLEPAGMSDLKYEH